MIVKCRGCRHDFPAGDLAENLCVSCYDRKIDREPETNETLEDQVHTKLRADPRAKAADVIAQVFAEAAAWYRKDEIA